LPEWGYVVALASLDGVAGCVDGLHLDVGEGRNVERANPCIVRGEAGQGVDHHCDRNGAARFDALSGGEDYELLFTVKQSDYEKILTNPKIIIIGYMT
jgi:thiamine monophosphate kinase